MSGYVIGFAVGMMLQLSVGPVFFTVLALSMNGAWRRGLTMTAAAALVDAFYIGLSLTSAAELLRIAALRQTIVGLGAVILAFYGLRYMRSARTEEAGTTGSGPGGFVAGLKLTLINPLTIVFWSGTFTSLIASGTLGSRTAVVACGAGCVSATLFFLGLTSLAGRQLGRWTALNHSPWIGRVIGVVLIFFAAKQLIALFF
ncbi:MAG: LysE family transporter [Sporolactobacillus sp.]